MADDDRLARFIRDTLRSAEQQLSDAKKAYQNGKRSAEAGLPRDEEGRARIVCRRHGQCVTTPRTRTARAVSKISGTAR
jgi:hypothetical protein